MNDINDFFCEGPILISGCGGGYDIFTGLPLYFSLLKKNVMIYLCNFSFTKLNLLKKNQQISKFVFRIDPNNEICNEYFPEQMLANTLGTSIIAIAYEEGVVSLEKSYLDIINSYDIKSIILADGGCDSILIGYEKELATPVEDMMNIYVVNKLLRNKKINSAYISLLGITADFYEGVDPIDVEKNINNLIRNNALVLKYQLNNKCPYSTNYVKTFLKCDPYRSIVNSCIVEAINENYGNIESKYLKLRLNNKVFISSLTATLYIFRLQIVADTIKYLNLLENINDSDEIDNIIMKWQESVLLE